MRHYGVFVQPHIYSGEPQMTTNSFATRQESELISPDSGRFRFRIYTAILALAIIGCSATPQGNPNPPQGGFSRLYCVAPPKTQRRVIPSGTGPLNDIPLDMTAAPELNNVGRPADTPANYVAYATGEYFFHPDTYTGELKQWSPELNQYVHFDDIDPWNGSRTLVLVGKD